MATPAPPTRLNLIKASIDTLPTPAPGTRRYFNDTKVRGLQLAVTDRGAKSWYLYARTGITSRPKRHLLGRYPDLSSDVARRLAEKLRGEIAAGRDPSAEKRLARARSVTLAEAFEDFREARSSRLAASTLKAYSRFPETVFADWRNRPLAGITKDMVVARHRSLSEAHPAHADHAMRFLRALFNFAEYRYEAPDGSSLLPDNPCKRLSQLKLWNRPVRRTTVIRAHQLEAWYGGLASLRAVGPQSQSALVADYLELMLLTGLRRSEAARLQWSDVDLAARTLRIVETKNHAHHTLPLSDRLLEILAARLALGDTGYVFPGSGVGGYLQEPRPQMARVTTLSARRSRCMTYAEPSQRLRKASTFLRTPSSAC
jgi:integrase